MLRVGDEQSLASTQRAINAALAAHGLPPADAHATRHVSVAWAWGDHVSELRELLSSGGAARRGGACWRAQIADVRLRVGNSTPLVVW